MTKAGVGCGRHGRVQGKCSVEEEEEEREGEGRGRGGLEGRRQRRLMVNNGLTEKLQQAHRNVHHHSIAKISSFNSLCFILITFLVVKTYIQVPWKYILLYMG